MRQHFNLFVAIGCLVLVCNATAGAEPPKQVKQIRTDLHGDPLPEGAIARLGLGRLKHAGQVGSLAFSPDGKILASGGLEDRLIQLWDAETGKELRQMAGHEAGVTCVAFSPDGKTVASGSRDKTIRFWDVTTGKWSSAIFNLPGFVRAIAFSPDGQSLASGGNESENIFLWQRKTGKEIRRWKAHRGGISSLAFAHDGKTLASGGVPSVDRNKGTPTDNYAGAVWDPATGKMLASCSGHEILVTVAFSPDGKSLASAGIDSSHFRSLALWETATGKELRRIKDPRIQPESVAVAACGETLAAPQTGCLHLCDLPNA